MSMLERIAGTLIAMGQGKRSLWPLWVAAVIAVAMAWLLYAVWRSKGRDDYATYGAFAVAVIIIFPVIFAWARRKSSGSSMGGEEVDRALEDLAAAVRAQWEKAGGERGLTGTDPIRVTWASPSLPVAGSVAAAVSSPRFAPLPGLEAAEAGQFESGKVASRINSRSEATTFLYG